MEKKWFMIRYGMNLIPVIIMWLCDILQYQRKIEDDPGQPLYIQTVRGVGYRFNGNLGASKSLPIIMVLQRRELVMRRFFVFQEHPV